MTNRRTVVLFTRAPEAEARAKGLPVAEGSRLFSGFLAGWQERARSAGAELLVVTPAVSCAVLARLLPSATVAAQEGETFGARLEAAFALAFDRGSSAALMVGGDGPPLDAASVLDAFEHLEAPSPAMYLVPSRDGGVNAIGLNARPESSFDSISWRSLDVHRQLVSFAAARGLRLRNDAEGFDLDSAADVSRLYRASVEAGSWTPFRWLLYSILRVCRGFIAWLSLPPAQHARPIHEGRGPPLLLFA